VKKSENGEPKCNNSSKHNNFHVPKQVGTRVNHGWDSDREFSRKVSMIFRDSPNSGHLP